MKTFLFRVIVWLALFAPCPALATISQVGASTGTTTCTVTTHNIGDLIVIYAYRSGSTGAPSLGSGYTSILTKSGTTASARLAYKVATATNDASGTWTNASHITCIVYRSSSYATGGSLYIGGSASASSTTTTVNYPALTMIHADNTSWALGFAGTSVATASLSTNAPSGMTFVTGSDVTATTEVTAFDTNGTVSSWSSTNTTVGASGNSVSVTAELIENQPGTAINNFVQHWSFPYQVVTADPNTQEQLTYNIDPTLAGNGLVVTVAYPSGATPAISDNKGNTWPTSGGTGTVTADDGAGNMALQAFVLQSATTGTSQIIISFGGSPQIPVKVWITQLYNITGTINGSVNAAGVNSAGIVSPGSFTPTNNNANGGNLVLAYAADSAKVGTTNPALIVPESNYALNDADISETAAVGIPNASQFYLQAISAATTPRFYLDAGGTETYNVIAFALSVGTQGTSKPSGAGLAPWIDRVSFFTVTGAATSWLLQIPSTGNCGVLQSFLNAPGVVTSSSATDSDGTSWTKVTNAVGAQTPYYNANQTPKLNRTIKVVTSGSAGIQLAYYDLSNCATSPLVANAAITQTTTDNTSSISNAPSVTPTASNQLTLASYINAFGPTPAVTSPSGAQLDTPYGYIAKFTGGIASTTLTVSSTAWGTIDHANNTVITGTGVSAGTTISSGTGPYTVQPSQTVSTGTVMQQLDYDSNTLNWGNAFAHFFNNSSTAAQSWTWTIGNSAATSGNGEAIILAGPAAGPGSSYHGLPMMGVGN